MITRDIIRNHLFFILIVGATLNTAAWNNGAEATQVSADNHIWKTYTNERYRYIICYPADLLLPQGESESSDGQTFLAKDGAKLIVYGEYNVLDYSIKDAMKKTVSRLAGPSGKLTYQILKPDWFVVSGLGKNNIFYAKTFISHEEIKSFELTYDNSESAIYEPVVKKLSSCFVN